jgi:hypothetical protein
MKRIVSPSFAAAMIALLLCVFPIAAHAQMQVYGAWHCYTDGCSWASVPNMTTFDTDNRWLIDRNMDGSYHPSVNVVVLSFVQPVKLMNLTNDSGDVNGIPIGMNSAVVNYFQSKGVRVMFSIGGAATKKIGTARSRPIPRNWASTPPMQPNSSTSA